MRKLRYLSLSEFGINHGSEEGRFNTQKNDSELDFNDYWWKEICRFEEFLIKEFPDQQVFVSDHVPCCKSFCISPKENPPLDRLCEVSLVFLEQNHPDASVVVTYPLRSPMPAARIVMTLHCAWVDQDIVVWLLQESRAFGLHLPGLDELRAEVENVDTKQALPWTKDLAGTRLQSPEFWDVVYSNRDVPRIGKTEAEETEGYSLASEIVSRLSRRYWVLDENESCDVYTSHSLGKHRIIKVECARSVCDRNFVESVFRIVTGIDGTWAVRFAVYEDLIMDNSYLGGIIVGRDGRFLVEGEA